jgi:hypothetical protein|tara:strand:- start:1063 stop:1293 length:231 start_codon:yes stop_codon:yes gene_type:complete
VKVGDLVDVNQERGTGSYKHTTPRGLGVILRLEETEPLMFDKIGPIDLGPLVHVLLNTGEIEGFSPKSMEVISESR